MEKFTFGEKATKIPRDFLPNDAKERFFDDSHGLRGYLPGNSSIFEILASRYHYIVNGCDYSHEESFLPMVLRPIGWGFRLAFYAFSFVFIIMSMMRETSPIQQYSFSREKGLETDNSDSFQWFVTFSYVAWILTIVSEVLTYVIGRGGGKNAEFCR